MSLIFNPRHSFQGTSGSVTAAPTSIVGSSGTISAVPWPQRASGGPTAELMGKQWENRGKIAFPMVFDFFLLGKPWGNLMKHGKNHENLYTLVCDISGICSNFGLNHMKKLSQLTCEVAWFELETN